MECRHNQIRGLCLSENDICLEPDGYIFILNEEKKSMHLCLKGGNFLTPYWKHMQEVLDVRDLTPKKCQSLGYRSILKQSIQIAHRKRYKTSCFVSTDRSWLSELLLYVTRKNKLTMTRLHSVVLTTRFVAAAMQV